MKDCIFCKIINKEIPSKTIYEDDLVIAFLDINPNSNGHTLIVPKKHYKDFSELDDEIILHINKITKLIKERIYDKLKPDGIKLVNNYGILQDVKHYHLHIIPAYKTDYGILNIDEIYNKLK